MFWRARAHATPLKRTRLEVKGINTLFKTQTRELYTLFNPFTPKFKKYILPTLQERNVYVM